MNLPRGAVLPRTALALIALTNAIALGGAAYNRSGVPEAQLTLSGRELSVPWRGHDEENSGLALRLLVNLPGDEELDRSLRPASNVPWLDAAKLAALGVRPLPPDRHGERERVSIDTFPVLLALELDGPAYAAAVRAACQADRVDGLDDEREPPARRTQRLAERCAAVRERGSRLYAIDAGLDREALRASHPDRARVAIVQGTLQLARSARADGPDALASVEVVSGEQLHVPLAMRGAFESPRGEGRAESRHHDLVVRLAFGQRLEPWIVSAARAPEAARER